MRYFRLLLVLFVVGCTGTAQVSAPVVAVPNRSNEKLPGKYAVNIQSGGWNLTTKKTGPAAGCDFWKFDTPIDAAFNTAMQSTLRAMFENVEFRSDLRDAETLEEQDIDAQISIIQGPANSEYGFVPKILTQDTVTAVSLTVHIAIKDQQGQIKQHSITGNANTKKLVIAWTCNGLADIISATARDAVRDLVGQTAVYIDDTVREKGARTSLQQ